MKIEILYLDGCPHVQPTIERLSRLLEASGLNWPIIQTKVNDQDASESVGFLGSPTVRINGLDVEPAARRRRTFGMMCRTYDGGGVPSDDMIRSAITEALTE